MGKSVFQIGMSGQVVNSKWHEVRRKFQRSEPPQVTALTPKDLYELTNDRRVTRNHLAFETIVENARRVVELTERHGSFSIYLRSHGGFERMVTVFRKQFHTLVSSVTNSWRNARPGMS